MLPERAVVASSNTPLRRQVSRRADETPAIVEPESTSGRERAL
jgi:hypothetical protein